MEFTTQPPESRASRRGGAEIASGLRWPGRCESSRCRDSSPKAPTAGCTFTLAPSGLIRSHQRSSAALALRTEGQAEGRGDGLLGRPRDQLSSANRFEGDARRHRDEVERLEREVRFGTAAPSMDDLTTALTTMGRPVVTKSTQQGPAESVGSAEGVSW